MKKLTTYLFLACACLLWVSACSSLSEKEENNKTSCAFKKDKDKRINNTPPFSKATKIEAISFDFDKLCKEAVSLKKSMEGVFEPVKIENGVLFVPYILSRYTLAPKQVTSLFETLIYNHTVIYNHKIVVERASCYNPRDVLVFYEGDKPFAFLELCFQCRGWREYNCNFKDFCDEKWQKLASFFPKTQKKINKKNYYGNPKDR